MAPPSSANNMRGRHTKGPVDDAPWHLAAGLAFARARIDLQWQYKELRTSLDCGYVADMAIAANGLASSAHRMMTVMHDMMLNESISNTQLRASRYESHLFREAIAELFASCLATGSPANSSVRVVDILERSAIAVNLHLSAVLNEPNAGLNAPGTIPAEGILRRVYNATR